MVPKSAIGKPKAALVATAFCILTLHQIIQGTEIKPPPAPTKAERIPIAMPMKNLPIVPGKLRSGRGDLFKNILNAENPTKAAKIKDSQNVGNQPAICAPTTAPELGKSLSDPIKMYLSDIYTISVNLAGLPGISIPCGIDSKGLPIGLQITERPSPLGDICTSRRSFSV